MMSARNPYHVYIVRCSDGTLYTGIARNLEKRINQHNGLARGGSKYVRGRRPVVLAYVEKFESRSEASKREYEIKAMARDEKDKLIAGEIKASIFSAI